MIDKTNTTPTWAYSTALMTNQDRILRLLLEGYEPFATSKEWLLWTVLHFRRKGS